jgi:hypothetical protein
MQILIGLIVFAGLAFVVINLLSNRRTKLFRRVWSSERVGGSYGLQKQNEAIGELLADFGMDFGAGDDEIKASVGDLLAAATEFDVRHQRNMGIQVMPILARRLSAHQALRGRPDIVADLASMAAVDGVAMHRALKRTL